MFAIVACQKTSLWYPVRAAAFFRAVWLALHSGKIQFTEAIYSLFMYSFRIKKENNKNNNFKTLLL